MSGKVTFEIIKGELEGKKFEYENPDRVFVGRQEDCGIVLPENTVSRYHCLLDINPPVVKLQDFGSLNGTFLNEVKIGQRDRDKSWEEAKDEEHTEYEIHDGDSIRLGKRCELKCIIEQPEMVISEVWDGTIPEDNVQEENAPEENVQEDNVQEEKSEEPEAISADSEDKAEDKIDEIIEELKDRIENLNEALIEIEEEESSCSSVSIGEQKVCVSCGRMFPPSSDDETLCPDCREDRDKVILAILAAMIGGAAPADQMVPSPVKGYDKVMLLGKGGMGEVWKVKDNKTGKYYALKTMLPQVAADDKARKMFLREAKLSELLNHKNVVRTYETGCSNGTFYILMDICEGGSADDLIKKYGGRLPLNIATYIMLQVLDGLDYVHNADVEAEIKKKGFFGFEKMVTVDTKGVVHRDFKPGNIFLSDTSDHPVAMVADFGMAKAFQIAGLSNMSEPEAVKGTIPFMPRQQALDCRFAKPAVDVWAAAATYYYMLTGEFPKNIQSGKNMWIAIVSEKAVPIRNRDSSINEKIARVIDKALIEIPEIGYQSAADFKRDLVNALSPETRHYCKGIL